MPKTSNNNSKQPSTSCPATDSIDSQVTQTISTKPVDEACIGEDESGEQNNEIGETQACETEVCYASASTSSIGSGMPGADQQVFPSMPDNLHLPQRATSSVTTGNDIQHQSIVQQPSPDDGPQEKYICTEKLGEGVFGTVYKAIQRDTSRVVAVKKIKTEMECEFYHQGVPGQILREAACLRDLVHPNVVELLDVLVLRGMNEYHFVFEYVEGDLHKLLKSLRNNSSRLGIALVRRYTLELLSGIHACHARLIIHRDLKPQNILIGRDGLKIADFGLARMFTIPNRNYSLEVVTLWYRAPEILLGCQKYGPEVDMWSAGCIIAEMATGSAIFNGDCEIGTVFKIFKVCGTPTEETWPALPTFEHWRPGFPQWPATNHKDIADRCPELGEDSEELVLIRNLLVLNTTGRLNAFRAKKYASDRFQLPSTSAI